VNLVDRFPENIAASSLDHPIPDDAARRTAHDDSAFDADRRTQAQTTVQNAGDQNRAAIGGRTLLIMA
jgi:hypothetical protein